MFLDVVVCDCYKFLRVYRHGVFSKNIIKFWLTVLLALSILRELTEWNE